ncbi:hypothetical protein [Shewanella baltica]|uniref:hypothetical protein n=1 Tax=Shewanella baltica TaxID=62322 RepID=UPI003D7ADE3B
MKYNIFKYLTPLFFLLSCSFDVSAYNNKIKDLSNITDSGYSFKVKRMYKIENGSKVLLDINQQKESVVTFSPFAYSSLNASFRRSNELCNKYFEQYSILNGDSKRAFDSCISQYVQLNNTFALEKTSIPDCENKTVTWGSSDKINHCSSQITAKYRSGDFKEVIDNTGESKGTAVFKCVSGEWIEDITKSYCDQIGTDVKTPEIFNCQGGWKFGNWEECDTEIGERERNKVFIVIKDATKGGLKCEIKNGQIALQTQECGDCKGSWIDNGLTDWSSCVVGSDGKGISTRFTKLIYKVESDSVGVGKSCPNANGDVKLVNPITTPCDVIPPLPPVENMTVCDKYYADETNYSEWEYLSDADNQWRSGNGRIDSWVFYKSPVYGRNFAAARAIKFNEMCMTPPKLMLYKLKKGGTSSFPIDYLYEVSTWCDLDPTNYQLNGYVYKFNSTQKCQAPKTWHLGKTKRLVEDGSYAKAAGSYRCTGNRLVASNYTNLCKKDTLQQNSSPYYVKPTWIASSMMFLKDKGNYDCEINQTVTATKNELSCSGNINNLKIRNGFSETKRFEQYVGAALRTGTITYKCELGVAVKTSENCVLGSGSTGGGGGGGGGGGNPPREQQMN